jgi:hypothetical protein
MRKSPAPTASLPSQRRRIVPDGERTQAANIAAATQE